MELDKNGLNEKEFLEKYDATKYFRPSVTVDNVIFRMNAVLLVKRGGHPYINKWALPGGYLEKDEDSKTGAARELMEETCLKAEKMKQLRVFDKPDRDPRYRTVTIAYLVVVADDAKPVGADDAKQATFFDMEISKKDDRKCVTLSKDDETLHFEYKVTKGFDTEIDVLCSDLAFDHANIIAYALEELQC